MRPIIELASRATTYCFRSKLFLLLSSFLSPVFPFSPKMLIKTLASVPAPRLSPVYTVTLYLLPENIAQLCNYLILVLSFFTFISLFSFSFNRTKKNMKSETIEFPVTFMTDGWSLNFKLNYPISCMSCT